MKIITYGGTVENNQIKLADTVHLPDRTKVFVVVPAEQVMPTASIRSPRLAHPESASDFVKEVIQET